MEHKLIEQRDVQRQWLNRVVAGMRRGESKSCEQQLFLMDLCEYVLMLATEEGNRWARHSGYFLKQRDERLSAIFESMVWTGFVDNLVDLDALVTDVTEKGKSEWEASGKAKMVLKALRKKFEQIPKEIEGAVLTKSDPIVLESMLEHVFDSDTLDEFAEVL